MPLPRIVEKSKTSPKILSCMIGGVEDFACNGTVQMFLLKLAFWLGLVLLVLPLPGNFGTQTEGEIPRASAIDAMGVAQSTISDLAGFCERNPETCETGASLAATMREKAEYGAKFVYEYLSEDEADGVAAGLRGAANEAVARGPEGVPMPPLRDTLSEADRQISWRGAVDG